MGPRRWRRSDRAVSDAHHRLRAALVLAVVVAAGLVLFPACDGAIPAEPSATPADCTGVTPSPDTCNTSTTHILPDLPELPCPTRAEIEVIRSHFIVLIDRDVSAGVLACRERDGSVDLTVVENNLYQALLFLRRMRFDRPLPWTDKSVYDWVRQTIPSGIIITSTGMSHSCLKCPGPIHIVYSFYESLRSTAYHLVHELIVHEARHAEGWPHTCSFDVNAGGFVSDKSAAEMGSWGVHYSLAYWLGHYSDEAPAVRDYYARRAAQLLGGNRFCCECGKGATAQAASLLGSLFRMPAAGGGVCGGGN